MKKHIRIGIVLIVVALVTYKCTRGKKDSIPERLEPAGSGQGAANPVASPPAVAPVARPAGPTSLLYVTANESRTDPADSVSAVSAMRKHRAVLDSQGLDTNRSYTVRFRILDAAGREWKTPSRMTHTFRPGEPNWHVWCTYFVPDREPFPEGGLWRWEATLDKEPTQSVAFTMLPPSEEERQSAMKYEGGREMVFRAFAQKWQWHDGHYYCNLRNGLLEVDRMTYGVESGSISLVESLNGIGFQAQYNFGFRAYRVYRDNGRWDDWKDAGGGGDENPFFSGGNGSDRDEQFKSGFDLHIKVEERDGNWSVVGDTGNAYLNGRLVYGSGSQHPRTADIIRALEGGSSRKDAAARGDAIRQNALETDDDMKKTMDTLRGRPR